MFRLLKVLLVLAVLALVVDRVADHVAEQTAAGELQRSQGLASEPDVSITGFPFLNQFASGHYERVIVTAEDVLVGTADTSLTAGSPRARSSRSSARPSGPRSRSSRESPPTR